MGWIIAIHRHNVQQINESNCISLGNPAFTKSPHKLGYRKLKYAQCRGMKKKFGKTCYITLCEIQREFCVCICPTAPSTFIISHGEHCERSKSDLHTDTLIKCVHLNYTKNKGRRSLRDISRSTPSLESSSTHNRHPFPS